MRAAAGNAKHGKPLKPKVSGQSFDIAGELRERRRPAIIRHSIARPLGGDDAQAARPRGRIGEGEHEAGAWRAVNGQHRRAARITELGKAETAPIGQSEQARGSVDVGRRRACEDTMHDSGLLQPRLWVISSRHAYTILLPHTGC